MKSSTLMGIGLAMFFGSSVGIDIMLSYIAYMSDPVRFIQYEANREIVGTFTKGDIPIGSIIAAVIGIIYMCLYLVPKYIDKDDGFTDYTKRISQGLIITMILLSVQHVLGGMTWHSDLAIGIFLVFQYVLYGAVGLVIGVWIKYTYKVYKYELQKKEDQRVLT